MKKSTPLKHIQKSTPSPLKLIFYTPKFNCYSGKQYVYDIIKNICQWGMTFFKIQGRKKTLKGCNSFG